MLPHIKIHASVPVGATGANSISISHVGGGSPVGASSGKLYKNEPASPPEKRKSVKTIIGNVNVTPQGPSLATVVDGHFGDCVSAQEIDEKRP